jgi:hypothetical protein
LDPKQENWFGWFFQGSLHHMPVSTECMLNPSGVQPACVVLSEKDLVLLSHFLLSHRQFLQCFLNELRALCYTETSELPAQEKSYVVT